MSGSPNAITRRKMLAGALAGTTALAFRPQSTFSSQSAQDLGPIWDAHAHLSGFTGTVPERVDQILKYADRMGIERLVLFMGLKHVYDPTPEHVRQENEELLQAIRYAPRRIMGMVYLNPKYVDESLAEMDRCVRNGPMIGVKLWVAMRCHQPQLDPIVRRAVELNIPVLQHTFFRLGGNLPGESDPAQVAELAARHPDARFICAHNGADWEQGTRAIRAAKNVWAELSGFDPAAGHVEMAVRELGAERVLWGSDIGGRSFSSQLSDVYGADVPAEAKRLILGGNLRRMLAPALAARGIRA